METTEFYFSYLKNVIEWNKRRGIKIEVGSLTF